MSAMISRSLFSLSPKVQRWREAFWLISSAEVATPPAFAALPGAKSTPAFWNASTASGTHGMFAPSETTRTPLAISASASARPTSFCVADGTAMSTGTSQMLPPSTNRALGRRLAYSTMRARSTSLI